MLTVVVHRPPMRPCAMVDGSSNLDYIAHAQESLGSALARVCNVLEEDDRQRLAVDGERHVIAAVLLVPVAARGRVAPGRHSSGWCGWRLARRLAEPLRRRTSKARTSGQDREERVARLLNDPEKLRELRQQRAERKAGQQQSKGKMKGGIGACESQPTQE